MCKSSFGNYSVGAKDGDGCGASALIVGLLGMRSGCKF
jgi:hypothetical protein